MDREAKHLLREIDDLRKRLFKGWQEGIVDRLGSSSWTWGLS